MTTHIQYIVTPIMIFINAFIINLLKQSLHAHVYSLKGSLVTAKCQCLGKIVLCTKIKPIMLALCLMLLPFYYAQNYAGIIGSSIHVINRL